MSDERDELIATLQKELAEAQAQLKAGYGQNWREHYRSLHAIHVEDVRRRKEVRNFRAANFSVAELEAALARKLTGKEPPPKEDWGALVMSALRLAEDAVGTLKAVEPHVPDEIKARLKLYRRRDSYYARHNRLTDRFKETRAKGIARAKK